MSQSPSASHQDQQQSAGVTGDAWLLPGGFNGYNGASAIAYFGSSRHWRPRASDDIGDIGLDPWRNPH